ncbi:peptidase domain-containing ABC transporter [Botrimarina hoheduenensis]|uniref:Alpha-hemolysin translocation ATP-binding protein HlyB n=1 Tax=Botrimarina hoheduenensis TaxID=2528000 RepID=A0A5C5VTG1_9BACT|nr:ABC transporter ATP-binding protein [Botrimarina hoheduenensis]TWT40762.1 Alpha-hemolysin translocation ATP-binding protein HlyB [Botrimarina hoheduenensis]
MAPESLNTDRQSLATTLLRISRDCGAVVERSRTEQLLTEARVAWPGEESDRWAKWLVESSNSLALRAKVARLSLDDALKLVEDGAHVIGGYQPNAGVLVLLSYDGRNAQVATGAIDGRTKISRSALESRCGAEGSTGRVYTWVVVEPPELGASPGHAAHTHRPIDRVLELVRPEWPDIWVIIVFALFTGIMSLATPIAVEALVDTVAFGRLFQQLAVITALLFGCLTIAATMSGLQTYVVEMIQRRLFARVAADLAHRLPRVDHAKLGSEYAPELANRFFDVVTLQKVVAQLLLDGLTVVLTTLIGMTVLAFYHPFLLLFTALLAVVVIGGLLFLGRGAIDSGINESKMKYKIGAWLEDLMRCPTGFKGKGGSEFAADRANLLVSKYLSSRRKHFRLLFRQVVFVLALQAIAGTVLLAGGGWLVMQGQLSLGQLVAAELIVSTILASLAKLGKHLEGFYDLTAAVDKLGHLFDLSIERHDGLLSVPQGTGFGVRLTDVQRHGRGEALSSGVTVSIEPGERVALYGRAGTGKTTLLNLLYGVESPDDGHIEIEGADPRDLRPDVLRAKIALVGEPETFAGTVMENVRIGRPEVTSTDVRKALEAIGLLDDILELPDGIETHLGASGVPLTPNQLRLLMIARAIVSRPSLVMVDGTLDALPDAEFDDALAALTDRTAQWTLVLATGKKSIAQPFGRILHFAADEQPGQERLSTSRGISE